MDNPATGIWKVVKIKLISGRNRSSYDFCGLCSDVDIRRGRGHSWSITTGSSIPFVIYLSRPTLIHSLRSGGETNASQLGRHSETVIEIKPRSINCISRPLRPYQKKSSPGAINCSAGDPWRWQRRAPAVIKRISWGYGIQAEPPGQLSTLQHQYVCVI